MIVFATLKIALRALRRNTLRTLLTMLGMIIGVGAVIAMVSIGNGSKAQIEARIASMGQNVLLVMSGASSRGGVSMGFGTSPTLTREDYESIRSEVTGINAISPEVQSFAQIAAGNQNHNTQIKGVSPEYIQIRSWEIDSGECFSENDVRQGNKVALIGKTVSTALFGDSDPVGQVIRIKNAPFTIVGSLKAKGMNMMGSDQDDVILAPFTSAMKRLTGQTTFRSFSVEAARADLLSDVQRQVTELMRQRHKIEAGKDDDFRIINQQEISETATATSKIMTVLLGSIAGVSLLVGGIGIMNIMLVSVTERTREIGVRMAVGARGRDILLQFLMEAIILSIVGGLIGIGMGVGGSKLITSKLGWPTMISTESIMLAFLVSTAIGIFFGFYPARKAAALDPIDALRYE